MESHDTIDRLNEQMPKEMKAAIACKKGCHYCCTTFKVEVSDEEADLLAASNIPVDVKLLKEQSKWPNDRDVWNRKPVEKRRCVYLSRHKTCMVHDIRPATCRKYFSNSKKSCKTRMKNPNHKVQTLYSKDIRSLISKEYDSPGNLSQKLYERLS